MLSFNDLSTIGSGAAGAVAAYLWNIHGEYVEKANHCWAAYDGMFQVLQTKMAEVKNINQTIHSSILNETLVEKYSEMVIELNDYGAKLNQKKVVCQGLDSELGDINYTTKVAVVVVVILGICSILPFAIQFAKKCRTQAPLSESRSTHLGSSATTHPLRRAEKKWKNIHSDRKPVVPVNSRAQNSTGSVRKGPPSTSQVRRDSIEQQWDRRKGWVAKDADLRHLPS